MNESHQLQKRVALVLLKRASPVNMLARIFLVPCIGNSCAQAIETEVVVNLQVDGSHKTAGIKHRF